MFRKLLVTAACASLLAVPAAAQEMPAPTLFFGGMWARATVAEGEMGGMSMDAAPQQTEEAHAGGMEHMAMDAVSAAYMTIINRGESDVTLVGAATDAATTAEIHEVVMNGDVMQMQPLADGLLIPAGGSVTLQPGGYHIMMMGLTRALAPGDALALTLTFATADGMTMEEAIAAPVAPIDSMPEANAFAFGGAWARPTASAGEAHMQATPEGDSGAMAMGGGEVSAAYMTVLNLGADDDTLVAVETPVAGAAEIHEVLMNGDVMQMQPVEGGIALPAGGEAVLQPGGLHIMLLDLAMPLTEGSAIPLTLTFASGAQITIAVPVIDRMAAAMEGM